MKANRFFFFGAFLILVLLCLFLFFGASRTQAQEWGRQGHESWHGTDAAVALHRDWPGATAHSQGAELHHSVAHVATEEAHQLAHQAWDEDGGDWQHQAVEVHAMVHHTGAEPEASSHV